ncbi:MAG TPA: FkbM family methyltransferase [Roseiarcus sp.]|nr:FkbM family methyltransferase [Roseiarcus sp.]
MADDILSHIEQRLARIEARTQVIEQYAAETRRLVGPWAVSLADGKLLVHTLHSLLMIVDSTDLIITPQLVVYRQWEPELSQLLWNSCRGDTIFVDVGANIGYFTVLAGSRIHAGGNGRVIAIEPNPECCSLIERNLIINWSMCPIELHKIAVGAQSGEVWLSAPNDRAANAHLSFGEAETSGERRFRVPMQTLDSIVPEGLAVDILKIDVEGHELSVFHGAHRVIAQSPNIRIIMEWSQKQMEEAGIPAATLQCKLESLGLVARRLPASKTLNNVTLENSPLIPFEELSGMAYDNILLTRGA